MSDHNPTMFCHDGNNIYYPAAPGRVYIIGIAALADCDGSDEDMSDSTAVGDLSDLTMATRRDTSFCFGADRYSDIVPSAWPVVHEEVRGVIMETPDLDATADDFHDALEQWADWCDLDSERIDAFDNLAPVISEMSLTEAVSCSQPAVAI